MKNAVEELKERIHSQAINHNFDMLSKPYLHFFSLFFFFFMIHNTRFLILLSNYLFICMNLTKGKIFFYINN